MEALKGLADLRSNRDATNASAALDGIRAACHSDANLLKAFVTAAHADCTLGEISQILREEFGDYIEPKIL